MAIPLAGAPLLAADLDGVFPQNTDAWLAYTPAITATTTNPTVGNGTIEGAYMKIGRTVHFRIKFTFGSTSTVGSGAWLFSLPVAAANTNMENGAAVSRDASAATRYPSVWYANSATVIAVVTASTNANLTSTLPFAHATGDFYTMSGSYEAAA